MVPSIVSYGMSSVLLTAGVAVLPIVVDGMTNLVLKHLPIVQIPPVVRWVFSSLTTGVAVYRTIGFPQYSLSNLISGCLYLAYKVYMSSVTIERYSHPSIPILQRKYIELMERVTIPFAGRSKDEKTFARSQCETIRKKWQEPETVRLADELIERAAKEMKALHSELQLAAHRSGVPTRDFLKKMAEELTRKEGPYTGRFCDMYTRTLLDIYRAVRGLRFYVTREGNSFPYDVVEFEQSAADSDPFFDDLGDSDQTRWRDTYNEIMDLFEPLMSELKKLPDEQRSKVQYYYEWAVKDDQRQIAQMRDSSGLFMLWPCAKVPSSVIGT